MVRAGSAADRFLARLRDAADAAGIGGGLRAWAIADVTVRGVAGDGFHLAGGLTWTAAGTAVAEEAIAFEAGADAGERAVALFTTTYGGGAP